ncbi:MAG: FAD-dependent oxidoreductase [Actinomycetota bacterium]|nr:FAD-dependent oxidoreductase [Actinomycetota bacterium]
MPIDLPGSHLQNIFTFWNVVDTVKVKAFIDENKPRKAVIAGAGSIGLLMAETFKALGIEVTIVELAEKILKEYETEITDLVAEALQQNQIKVMLSSKILSFDGRGSNLARSATVSQCSETINLETDMVLMSVGVRPNTNFLFFYLGRAGAI